MSGSSAAHPDGAAAATGGTGAEVADVVVIRLGAQRCGVPARDVREAVAVPPVTRLPVAVPWLAGVGSWRGRVLALVDLRPLFAVPAGPLPSSARVVVVAVDDLEVGVLAEAVTGLVTVPARCPPAPATIGGDAALLVAGLADGDAAGPIAVLDTAALLALRTRLPGSAVGAGLP